MYCASWKWGWQGNDKSGPDRMGKLPGPFSFVATVPR